jgi:hypothetical protein
VKVSIHPFDVLDTGGFAAFVDALPALQDTVLCVVGLLGEQHRAETDLDHATLIMRSNYVAVPVRFTLEHQHGLPP